MWRLLPPDFAETPRGQVERLLQCDRLSVVSLMVPPMKAPMKCGPAIAMPVNAVWGELLGISCVRKSA